MFIRIMLTLMDISYIFLSRATLEYFDCVKNPANGISYLEAEPSIQCYDWGNMKNPWTQYFPIALVLVCMYPFGIIYDVLLHAVSNSGQVESPGYGQDVRFFVRGLSPGVVQIQDLSLASPTRRCEQYHVVLARNNHESTRSIFGLFDDYFYRDDHSLLRGPSGIQTSGPFRVCGYFHLLREHLLRFDFSNRKSLEEIRRFSVLVQRSSHFRRLDDLPHLHLHGGYSVCRQICEKHSKGIVGVFFGEDKDSKAAKKAKIRRQDKLELDKRLSKKISMQTEKQKSLEKGPSLYRRMTLGSKRDILTPEELRAEARSKFVNSQLKES